MGAGAGVNFHYQCWVVAVVQAMGEAPVTQAPTALTWRRSWYSLCSGFFKLVTGIHVVET
jgi:hypothetical protein